jgi:hypothetical protein
MTGLLDTLKETALDTGFLEAFETSASREALPRDIRDQRLLLCLYGLGTNAGLKRIAAGTPEISYDELLHIRRYIDPASLRTAAARVADATLAVRNPIIWGRRNSLRSGFHQVRSLGSQPDDGMACSLRRTWGDDPLACRTSGDLYLFSDEAVFIIGSSGHDRRCSSALHRYGYPAPIC